MRDKILFQPVSGDVPTDVPPAAFGRFRVLHQIGVGSLGPVFRGEDPDTREAVVIKQFRLNLAPEPAGRIAERLRGLVTALPSHPSLTRVIDAGLHHLDPYLVTELATGESLDVALREYGPAAIGDALPRLHRLADALDLAAAKGVWHGALQPRDILVSARATQMTGVGVAPILDAAGVHRSPRRPYAAPESVTGGDSSTASDQYALAAITYEWLFGGRAPRSAESVLDAPSLQGVNAEALASALMTAMAANPTDRFANCTRFVAALDAAVTEAARTAPAAGERPAPVAVAVALPLSPDAEEPSGKDALLPDDQIVEIVPPSLALTDLGLDGEPDADFSPPLTFEPEAPKKVTSPLEKAGAVAWHGTLGSSDPLPLETRARGFTVGTLVAVLLGGLVVGGIAGYMMRATGSTPPDPTTPPIVADKPELAAEPAPPQREATDVPVAAAPPRPVAPVAKPPAPAPTPTPTPSPAPPLAPRPPAKTAQLLVRSSPAGANVSVDGTPRGTTPVTLRDLALGTRTISLSRAGFAPSQRRVTLTADRASQSIDVQLEPLTPPRPTRDTASTAAASLLIETRPVGASVTIDGKPAGVTPLTVPSIAPGTHTVRLELVGYRPLTQTIDVKPGERRRVAASLEGGQQRK